MPSFHQRKIQFNGKSCTPLSPSKKRTRKKSTVNGSAEKLSIKKISGVSEKDQMNSIIKVLGVPDEDDLSFLPEPKRNTFTQIYENYSGKNFHSFLPDESDECIHLLRKMLEYNPYFRPSADECLNHPYFDNLRDKFLEAPAKVKPVINTEDKLHHIIHKYKVHKKSLTLGETFNSVCDKY